jgi:hypothetical protein
MILHLIFYYIFIFLVKHQVAYKVLVHNHHTQLDRNFQLQDFPNCI